MSDELCVIVEELKIYYIIKYSVFFKICKNWFVEKIFFDYVEKNSVVLIWIEGVLLCLWVVFFFENVIWRIIGELWNCIIICLLWLVIGIGIDYDVYCYWILV